MAPTIVEKEEEPGIGSGWVVLAVPAAIAIWTYPVWPDDLHASLDPVVSAVVPVLTGVGIVLLVVIATAAAVMAGRGRGRHWRRARRRWRRAMPKVGLAETIHGELHLPQLLSVRTERGARVLRVQMLPTQAPGDWARRSAQIAHQLGADSGQIRLIEHKPNHIDIALTYGGTR